MPWLYRLQTRAGLTGPEGTAVVVLVLALAGGLAAQQFQAAATPLAPDFYAAADAAFVAASLPDAAAAPPTATRLVSDRSALTALPDTVVDSTAVAPPDEWTVLPDDAAPAEADAVVETSARRSSGRKPPPVRTNLNTATAEQLQRLPRIGPALAGRILEYRRQHGRFGSAAELTEVRGIGDRTMERLAPWVHI